jgi:hypothetical protein
MSLSQKYAQIRQPHTLKELMAKFKKHSSLLSSFGHLFLVETDIFIV